MSHITIVIPTRNRARALEAVWPSYIGSPLVEKIVVVSDGSTDATAALVRRLGSSSPTNVELVEHPKRLGAQMCRATGVKLAQTEWVLFGEDDVWLRPDYCSTLLQQAGELHADIIAGRLVTIRVPGDFSPDLICDDGPASRQDAQVFDMPNLSADFALRLPGPIVAPHLHAISLVRRRIFDHVRFDPFYAGNGNGEETDFYLSARAAGAHLYFTPDTVCYHLRGPICASGGQRVNRLLFEYYVCRNTRYLISKHWSLLRRDHAFGGSPFTWVLGFMARREWAQMKRVLRGDYRSSLRGT